VADTSRALERFRFFLAWRAAPDSEFEPAGETVGNSPDGSPFGDVSAPLGSEGDPDPSVLLGRLGSVDADGDGVAAAITPTVAAEWKARALLARAVAVSVICSPEDAALRTNEAATSTSLWPVGRAPTVQTSLLGFGHTVNRGASTCAKLPMTAVTLTP
jgi:hypothetical protein